jgi:hypothetical protein
MKATILCAVSALSPKTWCAGRRAAAGISALMLSSSLASSGAERDGKEWIAELTAAYGKLDGYIADYVFESEAEGKHLEARLAADDKSGLVLLHVVGRKGGEVALSARQWNTLNDELFLDLDGEAVKVTGLQADTSQMMADLSELYEMVAGGHDPDVRSHFSMNWKAAFLLGPENGVEASIGVGSAREPFWVSEVAGAPVHASDDVSVTFSTETHGLLTVGREHGLLLRQSVKGAEGRDRLLELRRLERNPGREKLKELASGWPTGGARDMGSENVSKLVSGMRLKIFQSVVDAVSQGKGKPETVADWMGRNRGRLRDLAHSWVLEGPARLESADFWNPILERLEKEVPDGTEVRRYMRKRENRERLREAAVADITCDAKIVRKAVAEIFIESELKADNATGRQAKDVIEAALAQAYLEVVFDRKARAKWGGYEEN